MKYLGLALLLAAASAQAQTRQECLEWNQAHFSPYCDLYDIPEIQLPPPVIPGIPPPYIPPATPPIIVDCPPCIKPGAVPEPATLALVLAGLVLLRKRYRYG